MGWPIEFRCPCGCGTCVHVSRGQLVRLIRSAIDGLAEGIAEAAADLAGEGALTIEQIRLAALAARRCYQVDVAPASVFARFVDACREVAARGAAIERVVIEIRVPPGARRQRQILAQYAAGGVERC